MGGFLPLFVQLILVKVTMSNALLLQESTVLAMTSSVKVTLLWRQ